MKSEQSSREISEEEKYSTPDSSLGTRLLSRFKSFIFVIASPYKKKVPVASDKNRLTNLYYPRNSCRRRPTLFLCYGYISTISKTCRTFEKTILFFCENIAIRFRPSTLRAVRAFARRSRFLDFFMSAYKNRPDRRRRNDNAKPQDEHCQI